MIEIALFIVAACLCVSIYANIKLHEEVERLDNIYEGLYEYLNLLNNMCATVLSHEIYSNEPVIRAFINVLRDTQVALQQVNENFVFEDETPKEAETMKGYNQ